MVRGQIGKLLFLAAGSGPRSVYDDENGRATGAARIDTGEVEAVTGIVGLAHVSFASGRLCLGISPTQFLRGHQVAGRAR